MVSVRKKIIKGIAYLYAEHSFRLPDGSIKKLSKIIKRKEEANNKETKDYFLIKEVEAYKEHALKIFKPDSILTADKIARIESFRAKYRQLIKRLTKKQMKDILDRFTINFTYESNAIEGNSLTLKDVTLILSENVMPKGKDLREVFETRNTREANEFLFDNKIKIDIKWILRIHSILIKDTGVSPGFKRFPNFLLMRDVKTTPPERVEEEIKSLIKWYESKRSIEHPVRLASEFHGAFEKIHPFEDGNGRTGRLLINAILLENGYPPLIIRKTMRQAYFSALEAYDNGHKPKLERFVLEKLENTFEKFFEIYVGYL